MTLACCPAGHKPTSLTQVRFQLFALAVLVNYPWERAQSRLYILPGGAKSRGGCVRRRVWQTACWCC